MKTVLACRPQEICKCRSQMSICKCLGWARTSFWGAFPGFACKLQVKYKPSDTMPLRFKAKPQKTPRIIKRGLAGFSGLEPQLTRRCVDRRALAIAARKKPGAGFRPGDIDFRHYLIRSILLYTVSRTFFLPSLGVIPVVILGPSMRGLDPRIHQKELYSSK